jgi:hypothetical protein
MFCSAKPGVTGLVYNEKGRNFHNVLYVRYVHLKNAKLINKRKTHPLIREDVA